MAEPGTVAVLCVSPYLEDHRKLEAIFAHSNWNLKCVERGADALRIIRKERQSVVITESRLPDQDWVTLLDALIRVGGPLPRLIVTSRLADDDLWLEVLNRGGYNVLKKPFDAEEVYWVVRHAWLDWKSECDRTQYRPETRTSAVGQAGVGG